MSISSGEVRPDPADEFEQQALDAGLTLPRTRRARLRGVAAIVAVILIVSVGVGVATGWMDFRPTSSGPPGLFGTQSCSAFVGQQVRLEGATSPDPDPVFTTSLAELASQFTGAYGSCVSIEYPTHGTAGGLSGLSDRAADFAVLESPPNASQLAALTVPAYVLPIGLASVSIVYNLPNLGGTLHLNGTVLAAIYEGKITQWSSPQISQLNPGTVLPKGLPISVVERSDAAPLNSEFSGYLAASSPSWNASVGVSARPVWPIGTGAPSGSALVGTVTNTSGSIGYVATGGALPATVATATLENAAGSFIPPSPSSVAAAATSLASRTLGAGANWTGTSLFDAPGNLSYPASFLSYLVVYQDLGHSLGGNLTLLSAEWEMTFLWWVLTDGGYLTAPLGYVELPSTIIAASQTVMEKVAYDGRSVLESSEGTESGGETGEF